jgi:hypothetical protein
MVNAVAVQRTTLIELEYATPASVRLDAATTLLLIIDLEN